MKLYTDATGKFQMLIPVEWEYKNPYIQRNEGEPHAFGTYDKLLGAFQISCKPVTNHIENVIKNKGLIVQQSGVKQLKFSEDYLSMNETETYLWTCAVDDHFVLVTYIIDTKASKKKKAQAELLDVHKVISSFKFIKPEFRDRVLTLRRYGLFMVSIAATIDLRNRALKNGAFIELVVLTANRIDGLLRLAIILTDQLEQKNEEIDTSILFQGESDNIIMERKIYQAALSKGIISQQIFDELERLYQERNKVVHRYIITDIRTENVLMIAKAYSEIENKVDEIINKLEQEQYELKIGINATDTPPGERLDGQLLSRLLTEIRDKHGRVKWETIEDK